VRTLVETEGWVLVSHQCDIDDDAVQPAVDADEQVEEAAWVPTGDQQEQAGEDDDQVEQREAGGTRSAEGPAADDGPWVGEQVEREDADDEQVRDGEQPGLDQDQSTGEVLGVVDIEVGRIVGPGQGERRVAVGTQGGVDVEPDPPIPAQDADVEVEQPARVAAGEENREAGDHGGDQECDPQERHTT